MKRNECERNRNQLPEIPLCFFLSSNSHRMKPNICLLIRQKQCILRLIMMPYKNDMYLHICENYHLESGRATNKKKYSLAHKTFFFRTAHYQTRRKPFGESRKYFSHAAKSILILIWAILCQNDENFKGIKPWQIWGQKRSLRQYVRAQFLNFSKEDMISTLLFDKIARRAIQQTIGARKDWQEKKTE
jgi:hypothetical protein